MTFFFIPVGTNEGEAISVDIIGAVIINRYGDVQILDRLNQSLWKEHCDDENARLQLLFNVTTVIRTLRANLLLPMIDLPNGEIIDPDVVSRICRTGPGFATTGINVISKTGRIMRTIALPPDQVQQSLDSIVPSLPHESFFVMKDTPSTDLPEENGKTQHVLASRGEAISYDSIGALLMTKNGIVINDPDNQIALWEAIPDSEYRSQLLRKISVEIMAGRNRLGMPTLQLPSGELIDIKIIARTARTKPDTINSGIRILGKSDGNLIKFIEAPADQIPRLLAAINQSLNAA